MTQASEALSRRTFLTKSSTALAGIATGAALGTAMIASPILSAGNAAPTAGFDGPAPVLTPRERVDMHIAGLEAALRDLDMGPLQATVCTYEAAVIQVTHGKPFFPVRGVPIERCRIED